MARQRLWVVLGGIGLFGLFLGVLVLLTQAGGSDSPTPTPTLSGPASPVIIPTPALPTPSTSPTGAAGTDEPGDDHDHSAGEDCGQGPVSCDPGEEMVDIPMADFKASQAVAGTVKSFVTSWLSIDSTEPGTQRAARLHALGASALVSTQSPKIARADSGQQGLTVHATPQRKMMPLFLGREDGLLKFRTGVNVDTEYQIITGSKSFHVIGGSVTVYVTDAGVIEKVTEDFPTVGSMH